MKEKIKQLIKKHPNYFTLGKEFRKLFPKDELSITIGNDYTLGSVIYLGHIQTL